MASGGDKADIDETSKLKDLADQHIIDANLHMRWKSCLQADFRGKNLKP